ncbi:MAG: hypothetical protein LBI92_09275 [Azoarcus sp.]|jgi:hypothetical protein|nr:hypothetical protein [Azoarcus sp.]
MSTIKNILLVLALIVCYGIVGNMDYADEMGAAHRTEDARLLWRDCVADAALRDITSATLPDGQAPIGEPCIAFLR